MGFVVVLIVEDVIFFLEVLIVCVFVLDIFYLCSDVEGVWFLNKDDIIVVVKKIVNF